MVLKTERLLIRPVRQSGRRNIWLNFNASDYAQYDIPHSAGEAEARARSARWARTDGSAIVLDGGIFERTRVSSRL